MSWIKRKLGLSLLFLSPSRDDLGKVLVLFFLSIATVDSVDDYCACLGTDSGSIWTICGTSYEMGTNHWANSFCRNLVGSFPSCYLQVTYRKGITNESPRIPRLPPWLQSSFCRCSQMQCRPQTSPTIW